MKPSHLTFAPTPALVLALTLVVTTSAPLADASRPDHADKRVGQQTPQSASTPPTTNSPSSSPYAGEERRAIKALAPDQVAGLRAGLGMGYGRAAELNRYPGPMHVLELAAELKLTEEQLTTAREIHARMKKRAQAAGAQLVDAEAQLDELFREGTITEASLKASLEKIGTLQADVRGAHLQAHVEQRAALTAEQVDRYGELRGYGNHGKEGRRHRGHSLHRDSHRDSLKKEGHPHHAHKSYKAHKADKSHEGRNEQGKKDRKDRKEHKSRKVDH